MVAILVVIVIAAYLLLFYQKSPEQIAASLGLYTGDPGEDQLLDNMISTAMLSGGSIAVNNLEWELNDAATRLNTGKVNGATLVNGKIIPASALLSSIDSTHDYKQGSPDDPNGEYATNLAISEGGYNEAYAYVVDTEYGGDTFGDDTDEISDRAYQVLADAEQTVSNLIAAAGGYIPQGSLNNLWAQMKTYQNAQGIENIVM